MTARHDPFSRFRRHKKDASPAPDSPPESGTSAVASVVASTASPTDGTIAITQTQTQTLPTAQTELHRPNTAPSTSIPSEAAPPLPPVVRKSSPFSLHRLKARVATKRARSPAVPQLPITAVVSQLTAAEPHPLSRSGSPLSTTRTAMDMAPMPWFLASNDDACNHSWAHLNDRQSTRSTLNAWATSEPQSPKVPGLDRYSNIRPFLHNRVRLLSKANDGYINASPIQLHSPSGGRVDRFIAMQGPTDVSTPHVWRMVVEQLDSPAVIVMLTPTHEGTTEKCYQYYPRRPQDPAIEIEDEHGDGFKASVRCDDIIGPESDWANAIEARKIVITVKGLPDYSKHEMDDAPGGVSITSVGNSTTGSSTSFATDPMESPPSARSSTPAPSIEAQPFQPQKRRQQKNSPKVGDERVVYHLLYKKWPDFSAPSQADIGPLLTLARLSNKYNALGGSSTVPNGLTGGVNDNPRIVHCSAGVGRTGTFIALEHLMNELDAGYLENYNDTWRQKIEVAKAEQAAAEAAAAEASKRNSHISLGGTSVDTEDGGVRLNLHRVDGNGNANANAPLVDAVFPPPKTTTTTPSLVLDTTMRDNGTIEQKPSPTQEREEIELIARKLATHPPRPQDTGPDLIFETVDALKRQRTFMVQAKSQLVFLYTVLRYLWRERYAKVEGEPAKKRLEVDPFVVGGGPE